MTALAAFGVEDGRCGQREADPAGLPLLLLQGGHDLLIGITGGTGFVVLALANLALWRLSPRTRGMDDLN
jgi:hypothetical protein